jgi:hypothetical protein
MGFDLFQSRRNYNEQCVWWSRNESDDYDSDELVMNRVPSGYFMAKEENPESIRDNNINGTFMFERSTITIKTPDNIYGMKSKDLVKFRGEKWIVVSVQKIKARTQQSEFATDRNRSHYWFIELRR